MRWLCAAVMWPMLACQPFDDVGVVGQGDSLIAASETRFFSLYGVSSTEVKVVLARDVAGAALALEGQTVEGLLLPPDESCVLAGVAASVVKVRCSTVVSAIPWSTSTFEPPSSFDASA